MSTPQNDLINSLPAATQNAIADVEKTKSAWLAAREIESKATARVDTIKVDMIVTCQEKMSEQAKTLTPSAQQGRAVPTSQPR